MPLFCFVQSPGVAQSLLLMCWEGVRKRGPWVLENDSHAVQGTLSEEPAHLQAGRWGCAVHLGPIRSVAAAWGPRLCSSLQEATILGRGKCNLEQFTHSFHCP